MIVYSKVLELLFCCYLFWDSFGKVIVWLVCFKEYLGGFFNKDLDSIFKGFLIVSKVINVESVIVKVV